MYIYFFVEKKNARVLTKDFQAQIYIMLGSISAREVKWKYNFKEKKETL